MQDNVLMKKCVGSFIIWLKPKRDVVISILEPSKVVIYESFDLAF